MKYVAELAQVCEVSLLGSADLGCWAERLRGEGLAPVEHAGRARVLDVGYSKFLDMRFAPKGDSVNDFRLSAIHVESCVWGWLKRSRMRSRKWRKLVIQ